MRLRSLVFVCLGAASARAQSGTTARTLNGTLQGSKCASTDVNYFLSIPYAKPPVGDLRFAAPQSFDQSFGGPRDATQAAPACPQFNTAFSEETAQSEDCLFINVWAPANATSTSDLPVRVWLYGGGNAAGGISNPLYDGCRASTTTVQVSINYRVGPLGFLALESLGMTGNWGIQDQLLGLRWVQENIKAFGGDPSRVLLFGQSAGATDASILSSLPGAPALFHATILQSGVFGALPTLAGARGIGEAYVKGLGCAVNDATCVKNANLTNMIATAIGDGPGRLGLTRTLGPVVDGKVIPTQPQDAGIQVPAVIGSTTDEGTLFYLSAYREQSLTLNDSLYDTFLNASYGPAAAAQIKQQYPLSQYKSSPLTSVAPVFHALSTVTTLATFRCATRRALDAATKKGVKVWTYSFGHAPSCPWYDTMPASALSLLGATHTSEIPFVLGQVDGLPRPNGTCTFTSGEKALSATMMAAWESMAANGDPGSNWPAYSADSSMGINVVGDAWQVEKVDYSMCDFWDKLAVAQTNATGGTPAPSGTTATGAAAPTPTNGAAKWAMSERWNIVIGLGFVLLLLVMM